MGWFCLFTHYFAEGIRLDKAERNYSGQYTLEMYIQVTGAKLPVKEIQLILEEAVSIRGLSVACLPHGELRVSCSAGGDNPHYNWTLGDRPLGEDIPHMNSGDGVVLLGKGESGEITCTVWNSISMESRTQSLPTCSEAVSIRGLSVACLPHGELRVSCSAGGDNPHYNWTLGDRPLGEDIPHMNSGDGVVLLGKGESGEITCTVWNSISMESRTQSLPTCSEAVSIRGLSVACLPHGELRVSCSAGGNNPQYNWTLRDQPLGDDIPHMNSGDGVVLLGKGESGEITCTVWNSISMESRTQSLPTCSEAVSIRGLSVACLPHGELRVSCSAGGDNPHYNWTLGDRPLGEDIPHMNSGDGVVLLGKGESGEITCTVWNSISMESRTQSLPTCSEAVSIRWLSVVCLPNGELRVSCSAVGDNPQYTWSLGDQTLGENIPHMKYGKSVVVLGKGVSGEITCTVWNSLRRESRTQSLPTCSGAAAYCDVTNNERFHQCYGILGKPVFIQLVTNTSGYWIELKHKEKKLFELRKEHIDKHLCCFDFFNTGILRLEKAERNYSGQYILEISKDASGNIWQTKEIQLIIEEPVSTPVFSTLCLPHGELKVSCFAGGDNPKYTWSPGDTSSKRIIPHVSYGNGVMVLATGASGDLICTAWNNISRQNSTLSLPTCTGLVSSVNCTLSNGISIIISMNAAEDLSLLDKKEIFFTRDRKEMFSAMCQSTGPTQMGFGDLFCMLVGTAFFLAVLAVLLYYHCKMKRSKEAPKDHNVYEVTLKEN
ncbi:uncharacterized protein LOC108922844 isoform X2 [Scleropages formosus]|uniref:uncharacterized protein LOC108922844 isoform X2 n=1 Tax=Scleropages formosus TaxID=113540 RepID=UPI0010FAB1D0|nr:uncharacterized protein LOC108922844 isoform X2 [Scleropages formosus]